MWACVPHTVSSTVIVYIHHQCHVCGSLHYIYYIYTTMAEHTIIYNKYIIYYIYSSIIIILCCVSEQPSASVLPLFPEAPLPPSPTASSAAVPPAAACAAVLAVPGVASGEQGGQGGNTLPLLFLQLLPPHCHILLHFLLPLLPHIYPPLTVSTAFLTQYIRSKFLQASSTFFVRKSYRKHASCIS